MRILQLNSVYEYGSTGRIVSNIHNSCLKNGIESYVIFSRDGAIGKEKKEFSNFKNVFKIYNKFEEKEHIIKGLIFDKHGLYSNKNTEEIIKKIKEINPDIIHLHNIHGFYLNYHTFFDFLKKYNRKVIWTMHDCWALTGFCSHFEYNNCDKWKKGCINCEFRNVYPYRVFSNSKNNFYLKKSVFDLDKLTIITPSIWLKEILQESFFKDKEIKVINNSIDTNIFKPIIDKDFKIKNNLINKKIILGVSSLFTKQKGLKEYIKLSKIIDDKFVIVLIGLDKSQISKLPKNIMGIERTNCVDDLVKWYSNSDVFLNLTLEDTYPTVNLEARACGLPVVTYKTGGSSETSNYVVEKFDLEKVKTVIENTEFEKEIFVSDKDMCEEYLKLYGEIYE